MIFKAFHTFINLFLYKRCFYYSIISGLSIIFTTLSAYASEEAEEGYFFPSFRSGHNLSLLPSGESTTWSANQSSLPASDQTAQETQAVAIDSALENKMIVGLFFRYTYHINIISSFGFFVGSTIGFFNSNGFYGKERNFYPGYGLSFPTILGGLVQGLGKDFRLTSGIEYGAVLFPKMAIYTQSKEEKELAAVPDMMSIYIGIENFITRNTALTLNAGYRQIKTTCLSNCTNSIYLNSLNISSKSYFVQIGTTWIVGEFN